MSRGADNAESPADRRARKWRALIVLAGLVLVSSCFMPAVQGCGGPIVPATEISLGEIPSTFGTLDDWSQAGGVFAFYLAAYGFGFLVACCAFAGLLRARAWRGPLSVALLAWTVGSWVALLLVPARMIRDNDTSFWGGAPASSPILDWLTLLVIPFLSICYVGVACRLHGRRWLCWMFAGSCWAMTWLGYWVTYSVWFLGAYYGLYVSFIAACFLVIGTLGEATALTRQSWLRTLGQLLTCRLAAMPARAGRCPNCDYYLFGLTRMRCPECGRAFTFAEIGATPEEMGSAGRRTIRGKNDE